MRTSLLLLTLTLLVTVATACGSRASPTAVPTPTTPPVVSSILHFDLTKTHTITSMGLSMAYPAGWLRGSVANTTLISELNEDHDKGWGEGTPYVPLATQGYQVTLSVNRKADITQFSTQDLDALMDLYATFYSLSAPRESSIAQMFRGAPALRVTGTLAQIHRRDDYAAAERAIGAREGDGPGTIWGRGRAVSVFSCRGETL